MSNILHESNHLFVQLCNAINENMSKEHTVREWYMLTKSDRRSHSIYTRLASYLYILSLQGLVERRQEGSKTFYKSITSVPIKKILPIPEYCSPSRPPNLGLHLVE